MPMKENPALSKTGRFSPGSHTKYSQPWPYAVLLLGQRVVLSTFEANTSFWKNRSTRPSMNSAITAKKSISTSPSKYLWEAALIFAERRLHYSNHLKAKGGNHATNHPTLPYPGTG